MKSIYSCVLSALLVFVNLCTIKAQRIDSVDVSHYNLELNLQNINNKQIQGVCKIKGIAIFNQTQSLILDLQKLQVSAVLCNGNNATFYQTDSTLHIRLSQVFQKGDTVFLEVAYAGSPVKDARWGGFYFSGNYAFNMGVGMASNPPNFGRCWFPCIDNFTDRANYEFHITTDTGFMAVCSGLQDPATPHANGSVTWNWHLNQNIPTYIANVAVSKYVLVNSTYAGIARTIPVSLAVAPADTAKARASFAKLNEALSCFESKFGPYLFDRVGYVGVPFNSGAMEHACNISYPLYAVDGSSNYETLMAHELSHHWFGNLATTRTSGDMWLNEGWASYCEALFLECVYGKTAYEDKMNAELLEVLRWAHVRDNGYKAVSGVPLEQTYGTHVYTKGSLMVHSLRMIINDDTAFFNTVKSYLAAHRFQDVSSKDLQEHFERRFGGMITSFFDSYIYDKGHADLQLIRYEAEGGDIYRTRPIFKLMSRYKTKMPDTLVVFIRYYDYAGYTPNSYYHRLIRNKNKDEFAGEYSFLNNVGNAVLGVKTGTMLGTSTQLAWIKGTAVQNFSDALFTFTPQQNPDSSLMVVEHHFAGPWQEPSLYPKGIRISSERYWHITGGWKAGFKTTAFFNYDGTTPTSNNGGFLDNELITGTEDSLVLLYRKDAESPFVVETDLTKQMGSNKLDKAGRFWVNNLKQGDYVFGYKDISAGLTEFKTTERKMSLYPNPSDSQITVILPEKHDDGVLHILNLNGVKVAEIRISKEQTKAIYQTSHLRSGQYFLIFEDDFGKISQPFIVR